MECFNFTKDSFQFSQNWHKNIEYISLKYKRKKIRIKKGFHPIAAYALVARQKNEGTCQKTIP